MKLITSKENEVFKNIKKLKQKKYREIERKYLAEGWKFLEFNKLPETILFKEGINEEIIVKAEKFKCDKFVLSEKLFKEISSQENSQGVIVVYNIERNIIDGKENNIVVLNNVSDPGNLGTIIRIADAAGFKEIILTKGSVDCYNEKTVRSSMGSILSMKMMYLEEKELIEFLKEKRYKIFATALEKDSKAYTEMELSEKNAFIFGNEGNGIKKEIIESSDEKVIIPIYGTAESLNVAIATGIILYEVRRKIKI